MKGTEVLVLRDKYIPAPTHITSVCVCILIFISSDGVSGRVRWISVVCWPPA